MDRPLLLALEDGGAQAYMRHTTPVADRVWKSGSLGSSPFTCTISSDIGPPPFFFYLGLSFPIRETEKG